MWCVRCDGLRKVCFFVFFECGCGCENGAICEEGGGLRL